MLGAAKPPGPISCRETLNEAISLREGMSTTHKKHTSAQTQNAMQLLDQTPTTKTNTQKIPFCCSRGQLTQETLYTQERRRQRREGELHNYPPDVKTCHNLHSEFVGKMRQ